MQYNIVMTHIKKIIKRIQRIWYKPIPIFVFHQVQEQHTFGPKTDWTSVELFKENILHLKRKYEFISLQQATKELSSRHFRIKHYAVLTCDDAYVNILGIIPFLTEHGIPLTIFINGKYLDEKSARTGFTSSNYISKRDLIDITNNFLVAIASHGYEHNDVTQITQNEFQDAVILNNNILSEFPNSIPYYAYTWGRHNEECDGCLEQLGMNILLCDGGVNYGGERAFSRYCIDGMDLQNSDHWLFK